MIAIVNVDPEPRKTGPHIYEIRINHDVIARFVHHREDDLFILFELAARAVKNQPNRENRK